MLDGVPVSVRHIAARLPRCHNSGFSFTASHLNAKKLRHVLDTRQHRAQSTIVPSLSLQTVKRLLKSVFVIRTEYDCVHCVAVVRLQIQLRSLPPKQRDSNSKTLNMTDFSIVLLF